jgi:hypothetical protein
MDPANYDEAEEIKFDELEADGRSWSEGTIATLLAASHFDGNGFIVSVDAQPSLNGPEAKDPQPTIAQTNGESLEARASKPSSSSQADASCDKDADAAREIEGGDEANSFDDEALKRAYKDVVRTLKRNRESRTPSRNVSLEDSRIAAQEEAINSFFAQVDLEDALEALENSEARGDEDDDDTYLPPPEDQLKPHLGDIHVRIEPDLSSSGSHHKSLFLAPSRSADHAWLCLRPCEGGGAHVFTGNGCTWWGQAAHGGADPSHDERSRGGAHRAPAGNPVRALHGAPPAVAAPPLLARSSRAPRPRPPLLLSRVPPQVRTWHSISKRCSCTL